MGLRFRARRTGRYLSLLGSEALDKYNHILQRPCSPLQRCQVWGNLTRAVFFLIENLT